MLYYTILSKEIALFGGRAGIRWGGVRTGKRHENAHSGPPLAIPVRRGSASKSRGGWSGGGESRAAVEGDGWPEPAIHHDVRPSLSRRALSG